MTPPKRKPKLSERIAAAGVAVERDGDLVDVFRLRAASEQQHQRDYSGHPSVSSLPFLVSGSSGH